MQAKCVQHFSHARFQCSLRLDIVQRLFKMQQPPHVRIALQWLKRWSLQCRYFMTFLLFPSIRSMAALVEIIRLVATTIKQSIPRAILVWLVECQGIEDFSHARAVISDPSPLSLTHIYLVRAVGRGSFRGTMSEVLGSILMSWKGNGGQKKEDPERNKYKKVGRITQCTLFGIRFQSQQHGTQFASTNCASKKGWPFK